MTARPAVATPIDDAPVHVSPRARFEILGAVLLGLFLSALDQTIVGPILPRIVSELKGIDYYTWVVTAYLLTSTVTVPIYGKLSDLYGRKPMLMIGIGLFLVGSMLSGLSQTMWELILFRAIQGLGAGSLFPISLAVIGDLFTPRERGKYQGLFGMVFGAAFLLGPWLGGTITEKLSWHWVFFVNVPIGLIALVVMVESRAPEPIIPLHLFRIRSFTVSMIAVFTAMFGFFGAVVFLPLWYQVVQGASPTASGYKLLPFLGGLIFSSIVSGQVVSRTGRYKWLAVGALALAAVGVLLMTNLRANTPDSTLWIWMALAGLGIGPSMAVFTIIVQNAVPFSELGAATSDLTLFRQIGGTVGLTLAFTLFRNFLSWDAIRTQLVAAGAPAQFVPSTPPNGFDTGQLTSVGGSGPTFVSQIPAQFQATFLDGFHRAFSIALANSMWLGVGALAIAAFSVAFLHEQPLRQHFGEAAERPEDRATHPGGVAVSLD